MNWTITVGVPATRPRDRGQTENACKRWCALLLTAVGLFSWSWSTMAQDALADIFLACGPAGFEMILELRVQDEEASVVSVDPVHRGRLKTEAHQYVIELPPTSSRWQAQFIINRFTGEFTYEFGDRPFGESSDKNVFRTGSCVIDPTPRKF